MTERGHVNKDQNAGAAFGSIEEERAYWDSHPVPESEDIEPVEVEVKKNLTRTLSVRIDDGDYARLRDLSQLLGVGVTTKARMLLKQALEKPEEQLSLQALSRLGVQSGIDQIRTPGMIGVAGSPSYYIVPADLLRSLSETIRRAAEGVIAQELAAESAARVDPGDAGYAAIEKLAGAHPPR